MPTHCFWLLFAFSGSLLWNYSEFQSKEFTFYFQSNLLKNYIFQSSTYFSLLSPCHPVFKHALAFLILKHTHSINTQTYLPPNSPISLHHFFIHCLLSTYKFPKGCLCILSSVLNHRWVLQLTLIWISHHCFPTSLIGLSLRLTYDFDVATANVYLFDLSAAFDRAGHTLFLEILSSF